MLSINYKSLGFVLLLCACFFYTASLRATPQTKTSKEDASFLVTESHILTAAEHAGHQAEKKLKDLVRADYHKALSLYYMAREKAGFMALERFELALERAIGDIREAAYMKDKGERFKQLRTALQNWQNAFYRARFLDAPPAQ